MAWTTPITFVSGNVLTAAQMNTYVRDNTNFLHDPPGCMLTRTTNQSLTSSTVASQLTLGTVAYDTDSMTGAANLITTTTAGVYNLSLNLEWAAQSGGARTAVITDNLIIVTVAISMFAPSGTSAANSCSGDVVSAAAATYRAAAWQNSGSTVAVFGTAASSLVSGGNAPLYFSAHWVGAG